MRIQLFTIVFISFLFYSCENEESIAVDEYESELLGSWSRTDVVPSGGSEEGYRYFDVVSTYRFESDETYSYTVDFYGFQDENPEEIIGSSLNSGTYLVKGDSIFIKAVVNTSWEKGFRPNPETTRLNGEANGNRIKFVGNKLIFYYISYPADAPVATQMSYEKVNP